MCSALAALAGGKRSTEPVRCQQIKLTGVLCVISNAVAISLSFSFVFFRLSLSAGAYGGRRSHVPDLEALKKQLEEVEEETAGSGGEDSSTPAADVKIESENADGDEPAASATSEDGSSADPDSAAAKDGSPDIDAMLDDSDGGDAAEAEVGADGTVHQ